MKKFPKLVSFSLQAMCFEMLHWLILTMTRVCVPTAMPGLHAGRISQSLMVYIRDRLESWVIGIIF